jgi:hypothetical protein
MTDGLFEKRVSEKDNPIAFSRLKPRRRSAFQRRRASRQEDERRRDKRRPFPEIHQYINQNFSNYEVTKSNLLEAPFLNLSSAGL